MPPSAPVAPPRLAPWMLVAAVALLIGAMTLSILIGPADLSPRTVLSELWSRVPFVSRHNGLPGLDGAIVWQICVPRVVLAGLVGAMLALAGASYQGVFQNPLADPYLLGVASGAGLGATLAIVALSNVAVLSFNPIPLAVFAGVLVAVGATYALGRGRGHAPSTARLVLAGIAVGSFFTAVQTYAQQRSAATLVQVYSWIFGGLASASWQQVGLVAPYVAICAVVLVACRRLLDVLSVGDDEANSLGIRADRVRLLVVIASTLGTAAVVSVSGLIGFVGIIVPHTIRLLVGPSYRRILPLSILGGAAFLILADLVARTALAPSEIPIGVVTAFLGAPFFLIVLRQARRLS